MNIQNKEQFFAMDGDCDKKNSIIFVKHDKTIKYTIKVYTLHMFR